MEPAPTALSLGERMQLRTLRMLMAAGKRIAPWRAGAHGMSVSPFRYGSRKLETGELLESPQDADPRVPVVFIHGGGWIAGHHEVYRSDLGFLVRDGHPVANLDYPLAPEAPHPEPLRALLRALAHLRAEDSRFERVHLIGDSAGGNLVVMLALLLERRGELERFAPGASPDTHPEIASVISLYGVLDRLSWVEHRFPMARLMMRSYGGPASLEPDVGADLAITPLDLEISGGPPMWIAYGDQDQLAESSRLGASHLADADVPTHLECYPGQGHGFFNFPNRPESQRLRQDISRFLAEVEGGPVSEEKTTAGGGGTAP